MKRISFLKIITACMRFFFATVMLNLLTLATINAQEPFLRKQLNSLSEKDTEFSNSTARYAPIFGVGGADQNVSKAVTHYGLLSIQTNGKSNPIKFDREELVYYVLEGTGMLKYEDMDTPISKGDFFYVPINTEHSFSNSREDTLNVMLMGFEIPLGTTVKPTDGLKIANADKVEPQLLPQNGHGPSSKYQLLMGTTQSQRDRLATAYQVNSLYIIDFDYGGTNIPHRHKTEEEIYLLLQGNGDMVAGENAEGKETRFSVKPGDVFFYPPNTLVGFYSASDVTKDRAKILA